MSQTAILRREKRGLLNSQQVAFVLNCNITTPKIRSRLCEAIVEKAGKAPEFKPPLLHL